MARRWRPIGGNVTHSPSAKKETPEEAAARVRQLLATGEPDRFLTAAEESLAHDADELENAERRFVDASWRARCLAAERYLRLLLGRPVGGEEVARSAWLAAGGRLEEP